MPLYEYECKSCHTRSEVVQRLADARLTTCSECGGDLKKLISSPAIQFKGSGFYITDYARSGSSNGSKEGASSEGKSSENKSDSSTTSSEKPAATKSSSEKSSSDSKTTSTT